MTSVNSDHHDLADTFASFSFHQSMLLNLLAVMAPLSKTAIMAALNAFDSKPCRINHPELDALLEEFQQAGLIALVEQRWQLTKNYENKVVLQLLRHPEVLHAVLDHCSTYRTKVVDIHKTLMWMSALAGMMDQLTEHTIRWRYYGNFQLDDHPAIKLIADEAGREAFTLLHHDVQILLLSTALSDASEQFKVSPQLWQFARNFAAALPNIPGMMIDALALEALWRDDRDFLKTELPYAAQCWLALYQGETQSAMQAWQLLVKQLRKLTGKRKLQLPPELAILAAITLFSRTEPQQPTELLELTEQSKNDNIAWWLFEGLITKRFGITPKQRSFEYIDKPLIGIAGMFQALILYWLGDMQHPEQQRSRLLEFAKQLEERGYTLPAFEMRTLLHHQFAEPAPEKPRQRQAISQLWQRKETWEYALEALAQLSPKSSESTSRLAWLLSHNGYGIEMIPVEQKRNQQGWSKGRSIALKRLRHESDKLTWLVAQDRQVAKHIISHYNYYGSDRYEVDANKALPLLAGHPAVFWQDAPDVRIDVESGQIQLSISEKHGQLCLRLNPTFDSRDQVVIVNETPTRLVAYVVNEAHRKIAAVLGEELRIPATARDKVLRSITAVAPLLPIQADLPEFTAHIPHVDADEKIYAQLLPLGEGLRLQLLVRPLVNGSWLPVGRGNEIVHGKQDKQAVQTRRDLKREEASMQQILQACPLLTETEQDNQEWQFNQTQDALEMLSQLRSVDGNLLECVWPEGERMRFTGRRDMRALTLNVKRQGEWFALSGELKLDDGKVLKLRELLKLVEESEGRFIRLGDQEWLALDHQLRQRLQQLMLMAVKDNKALTVNTLTLPFIKTLAEEVGDLRGDSDWLQQLHELKAREEHLPVLPSTLKAELRDYQLEGFYWLSRLAHWGVGACLADDMGLGKTLQTLALLLERAPHGPQLVIAPTSVTYNWLSESAKFAPTLQMRDFRYHRDISDIGEFDVVVVSYGMLLQEAERFAATQWHSVVLDEAQAIKNAQTQRAKAVMALKADFRLALSGTPIENHLGELWSLFRFINPRLLGDQKSFSQKFTVPIEHGSKLAASTLKQLIKPFVLRRTKAQVLDELPPRTDVLHQIPLSESEKHWYEALRQQAIENLQESKDLSTIQVLAEITRLRRFCCNPSLVLHDVSLESSKLKACLEIVNELRENHHKALVFSQFVDHLALLRAALDEQNIAYQYLDGSTPPAERKKRVNDFQAGTGDLFLISLKAGGTGLNLTAADYVIHLDPWWNPAVEDQASDRAHRIGQDRPVTVYRLVMEGTIEEQIVGLHNRKRQLAADLLEGSDSVGKMNTETLLAVLRGD
ncbi:DEAD/DEAH box helicase [Pantoea sp. USHLN256]|uniref:DEAD/DEAH box helicase n=1 Tax=Pantoea sp. USHLN256 TaxID=3081293 RepID=UPI00301A687C